MLNVPFTVKKMLIQKTDNAVLSCTYCPKCPVVSVNKKGGVVIYSLSVAFYFDETITPMNTYTFFFLSVNSTRKRYTHKKYKLRIIIMVRILF